MDGKDFLRDVIEINNAIGEIDGKLLELMRQKVCLVKKRNSIYRRYRVEMSTEKKHLTGKK